MLKRCVTFMGVLALLITTSFHAQSQQPSASGPGAAAREQDREPGRGGGGAAQGRGGATASIDERTSGMQKIDGYFPLYWDNRAGSLFLEIARFDTDFLLSTGLAAGLGSND